MHLTLKTEESLLLQPQSSDSRELNECKVNDQQFKSINIESKSASAQTQTHLHPGPGSASHLNINSPSLQSLASSIKDSLIHSASSSTSPEVSFSIPNTLIDSNSILTQSPPQFKPLLVNNSLPVRRRVETVPLYISSTIDIVNQKDFETREDSFIDQLHLEYSSSTTSAEAFPLPSVDPDPVNSQTTEATKTDLLAAAAASTSGPVALLLNPKSTKNSTKEKFMDIQSLHPVVKSFLVGSVSGTCSTVLFQPLDLVKTRLQQQTPIRYLASPTTAAAAAVPHNYSPVGIFTIVGHIVRDEKVVGLWKGITPALTRCVPGVGLYFASIHALKLSSGITNREPTPLESICLGIIGRSLSGVAMIPFTVIKTRYESDYYQYKNMRSALSTIYGQEGLKGLTSGLIPTLLRDAPFSGIYLMMYTSIKKCVPKEYWIMDASSSTPTSSSTSAYVPYLRFSCGILAGLGASIVTQPADVIKTKIQLFPAKFNSIPSATIYVYQRYGIKGYFKGLVPRMIRRTLVAAMSWTIYEQLMSNIGLK